jgi:hypothetical protein
MKKIVFAALALIVISCSKNEGDLPKPYGIKIDYRAYPFAISISNLTVNTDNSVYAILYDPLPQGGVQYTLKKITQTAEVTDLGVFKGIGENQLMGIANSSNGNLFVTSTGYYDSKSSAGKVFSYNNNFSLLNTYTMSVPNSPNPPTVNLTNICNYGDDTYFVFDGTISSMKRYFPNQNLDAFIAGANTTGTSEIVDGIGLNAKFLGVSKIISENNIVYVIDGTKAIRKIEDTSKGWKVTTLIASTTDVYKSIAIDSQNNFYVLVEKKGIYKLDTQTNTLSGFKSGVMDVNYITSVPQSTFTINNQYTINFNNVQSMFIKNDDLYLEEEHALFKISNFQSKL